MHSRLEAAEQARGKHHAKTYYSFDPNAERESPPGLLGIRSANAGVKRKRLTAAIEINTANKTAFNSSTAP